MILIVALLLTLFGTGILYVAFKVLFWLQLVFTQVNPCVYFLLAGLWIVILVLPLLPIALSFKKTLAWLNGLLMGMIFYLLLFFLLSDLLLGFFKLVRLIPAPLPDSITISTGWVIMVLTASLLLYGVYNARQIKQKSYKLTIPHKETTLDHLNIVLISDLHLGHLNDAAWVKKIVTKINAIHPDLVLMAGDLFNDNFNAITNPDQIQTSFKSIQSAFGVYACMGNHDGGSTFKNMLDFLARSDIKVLQDECAKLDNRFLILGRTESSPIGKQSEPRKELPALMAKLDTRLPVIVLDHNPGNIQEYGRPFDLILCGHTHEGQLFPINLIVSLLYEVSYGYHQKDSHSPHVIVTSGAGVWGMPLRSGSHNEIVCIHVRFKQA
jgi:predicted MPP superfamily phosphohydrolase